MKGEIERIGAQLQLSFEGRAWHGPSLLEALAGVSPEEAHAHPVRGAHSIWELVLHMGGTYRLVLRRLQGDHTQLTPSEDWPPVPPPTAGAWSEATETLRELNKRLTTAILAFPPGRLDEPLIAEPPYTAYVQFIGITQHDLYHAGQIAILKRALGTTASSPR